MTDNNTGWLCPICKNVYAPSVEKCIECAKGLGGVGATVPYPIKPIEPYKRVPPTSTQPVWIYEPAIWTGTATVPYTITTNSGQWGN